MEIRSSRRRRAERNAQLLRDLDLYKVGHHSSRNATPKASLYPAVGQVRDANLDAALLDSHGAYRLRNDKFLTRTSWPRFEAPVLRHPDEKPSKERAWALALWAGRGR